MAISMGIGAAPLTTARQGLRLARSLPSKGRGISSKVATSAALPESVVTSLQSYLQPQAEYFSTLNLPEPLVHWGHGGNMAVVLLAMGGYGAGYLGWQIRISDDSETIAKAKDMHPKLAAGMYIFFALGALGGMMSLLMQGKPIAESSHVTSGLVGMSLLTVQALLPAFFASGSGQARTAHAFLGTGVLGVFVFHAIQGVQLGLSI
ncbi:hypothetical protein DUNSADRAFT_12304 [Dunaliella salina]|uniref:Uncharacterized protein n=1 Tax=Dunaliella salina TaxID=3046 RepID=A0ABQ7GBM7_DUNSA|nr:hypothetical protein DUNSADRAFT_12304 [Dunaliella salina]|eukprot:KAF5831989.1 hypothetical protein DUNSADRAFT_12304 [Dunaliella salina]